MKILLIDNYDSFTFNLQHLIMESMPDLQLDVVRNDEPIMNLIKQNQYNGVIIGPGPGTPNDEAYFGENMRVILEIGTSGTPILGVCLGFQGICHAFGGSLKKSVLPMHGKVSQLDILDNATLLAGVPSGVEVMRYHSIAADPESMPDTLKVTATAINGGAPNEINGQEIMAIEHIQHPIFGVQYHPESFATEFGDKMIQNFLNVCRGGH